MRISVVLPALDEAGALPATLARLQPLRQAGHEVIVVDGGSTDGSPALAAPLADRVLATPRGRARQMNAGAAVATGEVLLFLHADTLLPEQAAQQVIEGLVASGRGWGRFDVRLSGRHPLLRVVEGLMNLRSRLTGIATGDQAMFARRALFEQAGGFPILPLMEDITLSRRLKRLGRPLCLRARVITSSRRWEERGVLQTILLMWWLRLMYFLGVPAERLEGLYR